MRRCDLHSFLIIGLCILLTSACVSLARPEPASTNKSNDPDHLQIWVKNENFQDDSLAVLEALLNDSGLNASIQIFKAEDSQYRTLVENEIVALGQPLLVRDLSPSTALNYYKSGLVTPISECFDHYPELIPERTVTIDHFLFEGEWIGYPYGTRLRGFFYNKSLLQELGWSAHKIETLPEQIVAGEFTYDMLLATASQAIDHGIVAEGAGIWPRGSYVEFFTQSYVAEGGNIDLYDFRLDQPKVNPAKLADALTIVHNIKKQKITHAYFGIDRDYSWSRNLFLYDALAANQVLFLNNDTAKFPRYRQGLKKNSIDENIEMNLGFSVLPSNESKVSNLSHGAPEAFFLFIDPESEPMKFETACQFLTLIHHPSYQVALANELQFIPAKPIPQDYNRLLSDSAKDLELFRHHTTTSYYYHTEYRDFRAHFVNSLDPLLAQVLDDKLPPQLAAEQLVIELKQLYPEMIIDD